MAAIEFRDRRGNILGCGNDLSSAVDSLLDLIIRQQAQIRGHAELCAAIATLEPDISATAPEHVAVFSAGWNACRKAILHLDP